MSILPLLADAPRPTDAGAPDEGALLAWFRRTGPVLVGFSGGVDSSYLAAVAVDALGPSAVLAVVGRSASYPLEQWRVARAIADRCAIPVVELDTHELDDPRYAANPTNRCYFCKSELWTRLAPLAAARGMTLVDGTNADDLADWRPGAAAAREHGVRSPLAEFGFTKADVRRASAARALPTADRPSAPCLASRLPYGTPVTVARLRRVERAEAGLRAIGIEGDLRVRHHGDLARIELAPAALDARWTADGLGEMAAAVAAADYAEVAVDLLGFRSGSLNLLAGVGVRPGAGGHGLASHRPASSPATSPAPPSIALAASVTVERRGALALLRPTRPLAALLPLGRAALRTVPVPEGCTHVALCIGERRSPAAALSTPDDRR